MIQDIYPKIFNNTYLKPTVKNNDLVLIFNDDYLIINGNNFITIEEYQNNNLIYAFQIDNINIFITNETTDNLNKISIKDIRYVLSKENAFIAYTAFQINLWINENKFCGKCGTKRIFSKTERAMQCPACSNIIYPKLSPAVIVAITNNDEIVLTKYKTGYNRYALVAGFCEIGETLEDTIRREVLEEVGLKIKNIKYYKSQPWALSSSLLMGFSCELDGDKTITIDNNELKEAKWVKREEMNFDFDDISLTQEMMKAFKEKQI